MKPQLPWWLMGVAAIVVVCLAPAWLGMYGLSIVITTLIYIGLASSWNIVGGMAGQFSLGHSLFVTAGSTLISALVAMHGFSLWLAMFISIGGSVLIALLIAILLFRKEIPQLSFALVTLAFAEIGLLLITSFEPLGAASGVVWAGGLGITGTSGYLYSALGVAVSVVVVSWWLHRSRLGYHMRAVRDDESAATAIGINPFATKTVALVISAILTSIVSMVYASYLVFVDPYLFASAMTSLIVILYAVVGGLGSIKGPIFGAGLLYPLDNIVRAQFGNIPGLSNIVLGLAILFVVLYGPRGISGLVDYATEELWHRVKSRRGVKKNTYGKSSVGQEPQS